MRGAEPTTWANEPVLQPQRLVYLDVFRVAAVVLVAIGAQLLQAQGASYPDVLAVTGTYAAIAIVGGAAWRFLRRRSAVVFGVLLIIDGIYLAWIAYGTGGADSPFRYLILLHLLTVMLLASYRTGLKLALWHTLLMLAVFHLSRGGLLPASGDNPSDPEAAQTGAFIAVFWLAAFLTATLVAVNERELRRRRVGVEALTVMATELETTTDPMALAEVLASNLKRHFMVRRVAVLRAEDQRLSLWGFEGEPRGNEDAFEVRGASLLLEPLRQRGRALVRELDPRTDGGLVALLPDARNLVVIPLTSGSEMVAVVVVEYGPGSGRVPLRELEMLERFVSHGALALRNGLLAEQLEQLANVDLLTGVANRRTFNTVMDQEIRRAARFADPVSLVLADIDHFKRFNDAHGHRAGDQALGEVASALAAHVRRGEMVARYGGEEFAVVFPRCKPQEAAIRAEELRKAVSQELKAHKLTLSYGAATYPTHAPDLDKLVVAAGDALTRSKREGRNRVSVFKPGSRARGRRQPNRGVDKHVA